MSQSSRNLSMPYIQPSQAQKHVTHNEAIRLLDVLVQLGVTSDELSSPPPAPTAGERFIVGAAPAGAWTGHADDLAVYEAGAWTFHAPRPGWRAYVLDRQMFVVFDGTGWIDLENAEIQDLEAIGIGMTALPTAPFSAKLNAAFWTALYAADGGTGSLVQTLNKETTGSDAGFVFQKDFTTLGLLGLFGDDRLRIATSGDGIVFRDGIVVDRDTGIVDQPNLPRFKAYTNFDNYVAADSWTTLSINAADYNDQACFDAATNSFTAPVDGTYLFGATLVFKMDSSLAARMGGRLLVNGTDVMRGSHVQLSSGHEDQQTSLTLQTLAALSAGDTVQLEGRMRDFSGYFLGGETSFWGAKMG